MNLVFRWTVQVYDTVTGASLEAGQGNTPDEAMDDLETSLGRTLDDAVIRQEQEEQRKVVIKDVRDWVKDERKQR